MDIPQPRAGFSTRGPQQHATRPGVMLPTPPDSIPLSLPSQAAFEQHHHHHQVQQQQQHQHQQKLGVGSFPVSPPLASVDDDSKEQPPTTTIPSLSLGNVGEITPAMLAKYHLPEILLHQGPLPIRHIMGWLTTSVPGFSRIPPAKARKLVVAALEGNDRGEEGIVFDKVGWGQWDARRRGEASRGGGGGGGGASPPSSNPGSYQQQEGMQIPGASSRAKLDISNQNHNNADAYGPTSMASDSAFFSHSEMDYGQEDVSVLEHEADKMSLDGDQPPDDYSSSEVPDDEIRDEDWDEGDITDEEDWAQIGAAGLRARSLNAMGGFMDSRFGPQAKPHLYGGGPTTSSLAKSAPRNIGFHRNELSLPDGMVDDSEERAAVEALLRLGSM